MSTTFFMNEMRFTMPPVKTFFIFLLVFISGCSASRESAVSSKFADSKLNIEARSEYDTGAVVEITVHNTSEKDTLTLHKPRNLIVQKKQDGKWRRVRTLYCPCGASCPAPPERVAVVPGSGYTYRWEQKEQWCGEMNQQGIPRMHSRFPGTGLYRIAIRYVSHEDQQIQSLYKFFSIK